MQHIFRHLLYMLPGSAAGALLWLAFRQFRKKRLASQGLLSEKARESAMLLFWTFTGGMAAITLCPQPSWLFAGLGWGDWLPYFDLANLGSRVSLVPFSDIDNLYNVFGNILMFVPFGSFAALLWRGFSPKRGLLLGLGITCSIELWQLLVGRTTDVDDIILNTLGVFCGYLLWRLLKKFAPNFTKRFHVMDILSCNEHMGVNCILASGGVLENEVEDQ